MWVQRNVSVQTANTKFTGFGRLVVQIHNKEKLTLMAVSGQCLLSSLRAAAQIQAPAHRRECFLGAELLKQTGLAQTAGIYFIFQGPGFSLRVQALFIICRFCCSGFVL